ncbi:DUF4123 domain-containing protein [Cupriavidus basilensis]|uniref:DUF4123 domain-containing protein n=1 Tax=Cupriavidus basilensis TaxID=68895 RepID=UPI00157B2F17|nr:DUF4123 domain-containing protein [Cupriavidus basilensis]NUA25227.1 DUF4123 domain-containing protein [Cupriavidus basilensis]
MARYTTDHLVAKPWPRIWESGVLVLDLLNHDPATLDLSALPLQECLPAGIGDNAHLMPLLLDLTQIRHEARHALLLHTWQAVQRGDPPVVCAWLRGPAAVKDVASHLAACLTGTDHAEGHALWRFYDPRVFMHMAWLLRPAQLQALFGPCETWSFVWAGGWCELERPQSQAHPDSADPRPWWPDATQWPTVTQTADIEQVLLRLAGNAKPSIAQAPNVDRLLRFAAAQLHVSSDLDRRHYATYAAAFGQPFENHTKLQALWPAVASGEMTLRQALAQLSSDDWQLMKIMAEIARKTASTSHHG